MRKAALIKSNGYLHCEMVYRVYALVHDIPIVQNIQPNISSSDILCDKKKELSEPNSFTDGCMDTIFHWIQFKIGMLLFI